MLLAMLLFSGYCVGSFITLLAYRYPKILLARRSMTQPLTLSSPGSHCPHCQHPLALLDNVPLLSYLWLRGRCRYCQTAISGCYWYTELVTLLVTLLVLYTQPHQPLLALLGTLLFSWTLIALAVIDWRSGLLPDSLTLGLLWLGLLFQVAVGRIAVAQAVLGAALGYLLLWGLFQLHHRLTGRHGMGYGDFKLTAALGAWIGWQGILPLLWLSSLLALGGFLLQFLTTRRRIVPLGRSRLPFGPYLALAGWLLFMHFVPQLTLLNSYER